MSQLMEGNTVRGKSSLHYNGFIGIAEFNLANLATGDQNSVVFAILEKFSLPKKLDKKPIINFRNGFVFPIKISYCFQNKFPF